MMYFCCNERRRQAILQTTINGIDYLEVLDKDSPDESLRQRTLFVHFFQPLPADDFTEKVKIEGGVRVTPIKILWAFQVNSIPSELLTMAEQEFFNTLDEPDKILVVRTDVRGDFSNYRLSLDITTLEPFDPKLAAIDFSFKVECLSEFDCRQEQICPPVAKVEPEIDYLAKDYASFRQLMLDRMAVLMPQWREINPADLGIALVELLAYVGDRLSYQQDAIATEAYLNTARSRISVRRHARLVDYFMHDGCNARVWVQVQVDESLPAETKVVLKSSWEADGKEYKTQFLTQSTDAVIVNPTQLERLLVTTKPEVFEPLHEMDLYSAHNELLFYTWGDQDCCLPKGATAASLLNHYPNLNVGDVLIFIEKINPKTGQLEDADRTRRHAVRLTKVILTEDKLGGQFLEPPSNDPVPVTEIEWATADALSFPFCISGSTDADEYLEDVSVALGNIVLADHGRTIFGENLGQVPEPQLFKIPAFTGESHHCKNIPPEPIPPRFRPQLQERPLTQAATVTKRVIVDGKTKPQRLPFDPEAPAATVFNWQMKNVIPAIVLRDSNNQTWQPQKDLLNSNRFATEFVAEIEADGRTILRFGNNQQGLRPTAGTHFSANYRIGNGVRGNIGAETLTHIVTNETQIIRVSNPLPAKGGKEPETIEQVRQFAPSAFRTQERAVTPEDYAEVAQRHPEVQQAAATFRWTGSWRTVFVTVDRFGGLPVDAAFEQEMRRHLERYRMAGYDLEIDAPQFVSLEIEMTVCVEPDYFRSDVKAALLQVFSNKILADGKRGLFHPDNFSFGQSVYLSPLYAAAQATEGVCSVEITIFQRQGKPNTSALETGKLEIERLEIASLDNDPNFPENGIFKLTMLGGK